VFLADAGTGAIDLAIFQYGAVGILAAVALFAVRVLYKRVLSEYDREKKRADRLEEELARLNAMIQNQTMQALQDATKAVAEALSKMRRER
jgi:Skp family chaperone for outer membrane proteins